MCVVWLLRKCEAVYLEVLVSNMALEAPTRRHRGKSAPRGKSPDGKALKKAAKMVTPPPTKAAPGSSSEPKAKKAKMEEAGQKPRKLTFGATSTTDIIAENKSPKDEDPKKTDAIIQGLKQEPWEG